MAEPLTLPSADSTSLTLVVEWGPLPHHENRDGLTVTIDDRDDDQPAPVRHLSLENTRRLREWLVARRAAGDERLPTDPLIVPTTAPNETLAVEEDGDGIVVTMDRIETRRPQPTVRLGPEEAGYLGDYLDSLPLE